MPFTIQTNESFLDIIWTDDTSAKQINLEDIKEEYNQINIDGMNNEFENYSIFNRTNSLSINNCSLDLSQIQGNISYISLTRCACYNNFSECSTIQLFLQDVNLKAKQIKLLKADSISVYLNEDTQVDLSNYNELTFKLDTLLLNRMKIDVTLLAGCWNSVNFENCVFSGQVDNSLFQAQTVNLKITEINYRNNLENLEKLSCAWFYLSQAERDEDCHQVYTDLAMSNEQNQKSNLYVEFCNSTINLCSMSAIWHNITFINCKLIGNHANIFNSTFDGTQLHILCFEQCLNFDLNPLIGLQVQILNLKFENILIDFKLLQECKPQYLTLMKYQQLDVEDLFGTWNNLQIQQSNFINTNTNKLIIATQLILIDMSNLDLAYKYFISQKVKIRKTKTITSYPNACELAVTCSSLNITQANDTITHLSLNEVVLVRFSVLLWSPSQL
ncbi:Hypothetical_protein [Hexamita inflata]|uniref:Hypothetical_protein n=1 Tax=Hexamita inflata TaxID=28002 RepID=A0ABP1HQE9_9EUKA